MFMLIYDIVYLRRTSQFDVLILDLCCIFPVITNLGLILVRYVELFQNLLNAHRHSQAKRI